VDWDWKGKKWGIGWCTRWQKIGTPVKCVAHNRLQYAAAVQEFHSALFLESHCREILCDSLARDPLIRQFEPTIFLRWISFRLIFCKSNRNPNLGAPNSVVSMHPVMLLTLCAAVP
jgi:hypothetical protein